jgi:hypothetical protein
VLLRSWYEFDGLLSEEAEFVWLVFWACCMFPRMGGYTKERMRLFVALARVFMFAYEQFAGILRTPVSHAHEESVQADWNVRVQSTNLDAKTYRSAFARRSSPCRIAWGMPSLHSHYKSRRARRRSVWCMT